MSNLTGAKGPYRVDPSLRREGGQAEVLRAVGPDGVTVAIKMPRAGRGNGWFVREAGLLRQLTTKDRPWVVPLLDEGVGPDGRPFIVLPWFEDALDEWLERKPAIERIFEALTLACESVVRLHRAPVDLANVLVHRDVKPYNFLVRDDGAELIVVLADLGIAKEGRLAETSAQTGVFTEYYAPPEQQLPLALPPDPTMDVHGLAATVWFGICDRVPRSVFSRQAAWKEEAADLRALAMMGTKRTAEEEARFEELRRLPIEAYADLELMAALRPQDEQEFVQRLELALGPRVSEPNALARSVAERLLPVLRRGLEPDHRRRMGEAQRLYAAVRQARDTIAAAVAGQRPPAPAKAPVVVGPGGGTLVPSAPMEIFNPVDVGEVAVAEKGRMDTVRLPTLQLDETGPAAGALPGAAAAVAEPRGVPPAPPVRAREVPRTNDPSRTMDPFSVPESPSRGGWIAAAGALGFVGVLGAAALVGVIWYVWPHGESGGVTPSGEVASAPVVEPTADAALKDPDATSSAPVVGAATAIVAPVKPPAEDAAALAKKKAEEKAAAEKAAAEKAAAEKAAAEKAAAEKAAAEAAVARPVTLTVLRCVGQVEAGELKLDGAVTPGNTVTLSPGTHAIALRTVTTAGETETWPIVNLTVEAEGLRLRDRLIPLTDGRSTTIRLDGAGRVVGSRNECR